MKTSDAGLRLIQQFEGFRASAYLDPVGVWTIGFGHTRTAKDGMVISMGEAVDLLRADVADAEAAINDLITRPLEQYQFDALVSWAFNVGRGAVERSTLRRKLNAGDFAAVPAELMRWTKAGGQDLAGLVRRRRAECEMWRGLHQAGHEHVHIAPDEPKLKPISDSRTLRGSIPAITGAATAAGGVLAGLGALSATTQAIIGAGLTVALLGGLYVVWNRWQERRRGER